jgi:predicted transposase/invertase (TIGR01784 family)
MPHYLDPKNDLSFKRIFGEHKHLCISLLNSMLPLEYPIIEVEYMTGELIPELATILRNSIVDVRCTDTNGRQFLVEMQLYWSDAFKSRILFNASKAYVKQLEKGQKFNLLQPVYALVFVNEIFERSPEMKDEYFHHYQIVNIKDTQQQIKGLEFVFIELPKYKPQNKAEKKLQDLWLRFLIEINDSTTEIPPEFLQNEHISEALTYMETGAYTIEQLDAYDQWRIDTWTSLAVVDEFEKKGFAKGEARGLAEGEARGFAEGEAKGIAKGKIEGKVEGKAEGKAEVAIQLLKLGISLEDIMKCTGFTAAEIYGLEVKGNKQK